MEAMEALLMPFQLPFMQNAFAITAIVAIPSAILSCFLVLKGWSLIGDAISHAVLPGVVLADGAGLPLIVGAFVAGMICALLTGFVGDNSRIKPDTVMGVVFSGMFGLGVVLYTSIESDVHLDHILFGNMLGVGPADLLVSGAIAAVVAMLLLMKWRDLLLHAFDPVQAQVIGLPVRVLHYGLLAAVSACVVAMLSSVGIILSVGLLIAPGAIAFLLTRRFAAMMAVAVAVTLIAGTGGIWASFWLDSAPAPTIILILTAIFLVAFAVSSLRMRRVTRAI
ncbi:MAG: metal ABC transporter permease [Propionivibrio sp.]